MAVRDLQFGASGPRCEHRGEGGGVVVINFLLSKLLTQAYYSENVSAT